MALRVTEGAGRRLQAALGVAPWAGAKFFPASDAHPPLWTADLVREAPVDRSRLANRWQAGAFADLIVCQIRGWVPL